jgi:hypothetical protein
VLALLARQDDSDAKAECRPDRIALCSPAGVELGESAETKATLAGVSAAVGLAAVGAGVTLLLTAPTSPPEEPRADVRVQAIITARSGFVSMAATW